MDSRSRSRARARTTIILLIGIVLVALQFVDAREVNGYVTRARIERMWSRYGGAKSSVARFPLQRVGYDCAQAALGAAWTSLHGPRSATDSIYAIWPPRTDGATVEELSRNATAVGLAVETFGSGALPVPAVGTVAIALLPIGHFVVVLSSAEGAVIIFDPLTGEWTIPIKSARGIEHLGGLLLTTSRQPRGLPTGAAR